MAIHVGFIRAGWPGLLVAGLCFILPAVLITTALAWVYVRFGTLPQAAPFLYGIKPVVLAIILSATWRLGSTALRARHTPTMLLIGLGVVLASLLGMNEVVALLLGGLIGTAWLVWLNRQQAWAGGLSLVLLFGAVAPRSLLSSVLQSRSAILGLGTAQTADVPLWKLGLFFFKVGAVLYGSGYVLVAFLEGGLVHDYGWLTQQQLLDAIAIGQFTPGPVLSAAAFIGYVIAGVPGAAVAATAMFLPSSFFFVAALNPLVPRLRHFRWTAAFLDAVNVSVVGLMVAVMIQLAQATLTNWLAWMIFLLAFVTAIRWKINAAWLVLGGALVGWLLAHWVV